MAEVMTKVDEQSGHYAVGKDDTIFATGKEIANKAFDAMKDVIRNAKSGLTRIVDVGSRSVSERNHDGNTVAERKMNNQEVGKFSQFLANVGKNIEKGLSKLGRGGKVAMVVGTMLLTAAMSQQLHAANYIEAEYNTLIKEAKANPGVKYLYEDKEASKDVHGIALMMGITAENKEAIKDELNQLAAAGAVDPKSLTIKEGFLVINLTPAAMKKIEAKDNTDVYSLYVDDTNTPNQPLKTETHNISFDIDNGKIKGVNINGKRAKVSTKNLADIQRTFDETASQNNGNPLKYTMATEAAKNDVRKLIENKNIKVSETKTQEAGRGGL